MTTTDQTAATPGKTRSKPIDRSKPWTFKGIRIRPFARPERFGGYNYRVEPGTKFGKVAWRQFPTWEQAETHAASLANERTNNGRRAYSLDDAQRTAADKAFAALEKAGLTTDDLLAAVEFYVRHHRPEGGDLTVDAAIDRYLAGKRTGTTAKQGRPLRERSLADLETRLYAFGRNFGDSFLKEISEPDLDDWLGQFSTRQTRRNHHTILGGFFRWCLGAKLLGSNPLAAVDKPAKAGDDEREIGVLSLAEATALLEVARAHPELELGWYVALGLFTGARAAELERLAVADVKLDRHFLAIGPHVAKKRRIRNVDFALPANEETATTGPDGKPRIERRAVSLDAASA